MQHFSKTEILPSFQSDHSAIKIEIKFNDFVRGKGLWKHNNSLLHDKEYLNVINEKIEDLKDNMQFQATLRPT